MAETSLEMLEEWEEWDPESNTSFFVHAAAGSMAGAAEHCAMFPVDTIKTHLQAARSVTSAGGEASAIGIIRPLINSEFGFLRMWRGVSTMLTACIPAHAAYFSIYEHCKTSFGANGDEHSPISVGMSGICATVAHDAIMTPMDVAKQRLQLGFYSGMTDCIKSVVKSEGIGSLFLSFPTTLLMNIPYAAVMTAANESAKLVLNPKGEHNVSAFLMSGAIAGSIAALATNPIDVVKTRLQTQNLLQTYPNCTNVEAQSSRISRVFGNFAATPYQLTDARFVRGVSFIGAPRGSGIRCTYTARSTKLGIDCVCKADAAEKKHLKYSGFVETFKKVRQEEGFRGFARGAGSRVLVHAPSVAVAWTTYETAKKLLMQ